MKNRQPERMSLRELTARFPKVSSRAGSAARLLLGSGREPLVGEVVNDVLLILWRRYLQGNPPENPEAWAHRVAWNRAARVARMEGRYVAGLVEEEDDESVGHNYLLMPPDEVTPVVSAELAERFSALKKVLDAFDVAAKNNLSDREARLFDLVYKKHFTGEQVALELGVSPALVRKQWSRLLPKLLVFVREQLQQDPTCTELLSSVLDNEKTFQRSALQLLRFVAQKGVEELERLVKSVFNR